MSGGIKMTQKDPIIQNILNKRYEQEKRLYALEQQLMGLGYKLQDIHGNFMLDYMNSGKYTLGMESLLSKLFQTYLNDLYKYQNIHEDIEIEYQQALENHYYMKPSSLLYNFEKLKKSEQEKKILKIYHDILEDMKPINKIQKKPKLEKTYTLKR